MRSVCEIDKCNGCMACVERCPKQCITIKDEITSFNAVVDSTQCINCKLCERICPNISSIEKRKPESWYQGWALHDIRQMSTSGGAATAIMKSFILQGGYVASCLFCNGEFSFEITNDLTRLEKFAGSKYVKSNPRGIYKKIEDRLRTDKVLFVGLPCQVAAVNKVITNKNNLYTIDLICHGTPSIFVLSRYLREKGYEIAQISDLRFRNKVDMGLHIDGKKITASRVMDDYTCSFLSSINYTENCYSCKFATIERVSDITLGDSWGTELNEEKKNGISLILCQTEKGKKLISNANLELRDVELNNAIKNNHQLEYPSVRTAKRDKFLAMIKRGKPYKYATFICLPQMVIKQKIKHVLIKLKVMH